MREKVRLVSTAGTGYFYTTDRNRRARQQGQGKLEVKKYDPRARKHVLFKEEKMK